MKILAIDTSGQVASVAVADGNKAIEEYTLNHVKTHSVMLIHMIDELLKRLGLKPSEIDVFSVSTGPGSFTGLRIGVTTIKSMAYALNKPVEGVPTLDALAFGIRRGDNLICPLMDARNNRVYSALYKWENDRQIKITEYMWSDIYDLIEHLKAKKSKITFNGDAALIHKELLQKELGELCDFAPEELMLQRASAVAEIAREKFEGGVHENCYDLVPFYLRKSQAEREQE